MRTCRTTSASPSKRSVRSSERRRGARAPADRRTRATDSARRSSRNAHLAVELDRDAHDVGQHGAADRLIVASFGGGAAAGSAPSGAGRCGRDRDARLSASGRRASTGASTRASCAGTCFDELARRIRRGQPAQQADARRPCPRCLPEPRERVEREPPRLPQRVVAVAARRVPPDDRLVVRHDGAHGRPGRRGRGRAGLERVADRLLSRQRLGVHRPHRRPRGGGRSTQNAERAEARRAASASANAAFTAVMSFPHGDHRHRSCASTSSK